MASTRIEDKPEVGGVTLVLRPEREFLHLPLEFRWEATRRHPYYLRFWRIASQRDPLDPQKAFARQAARLILNAVNVRGVPVDPSLSFNELDSRPVDRAFLGGSLAPLTFRGHIAALAHALDSASLRRVAEELLTVANTDRTDSNAWYPVLERLLKLPLESLDQIPNEGVVSFNPNHPTRAIMEDLERYVGDVKKRHSIVEVRRRHDKLPEYFAVWDAREGWTGAGYDRRCERTLTDIARGLGKPVKTVSDHYRAAFDAIFGTAYTPDLWLQLVFPLKFLGNDGLPALPRVGRPLKVRTPRPVPESALASPSDLTPLLKAAGSDDSEIGFADLRMDIQDLIGAGMSDAEVCAILELGEASLEVVAYFRERATDGPSS